MTRELQQVVLYNCYLYDQNKENVMIIAIKYKHTKPTVNRLTLHISIQHKSHMER